MKTFLKIVAAVFILLIIIIVGLNLYFTDDRLKSTVMPHVNEAVGRTVEVESMSLTFFSTFPQPGISINKMSVPGATETDTLLSLDQLVASVELFSLMGDQINISEIALRNPTFTYTINQDGSTNLDFLMSDEEAQQDTSAGYAINIPYFELTGGTFRYRDATTNTSVSLDDLNANISLQYADLIRSTVDLELGGLSATVGETTYFNGLPLSLSQQSTVDIDNEKLTLDNGTFSIRGLALNLSGSISDWSNSLSGDLKFRSSSDNFGELLRLIPEEYSQYTSGLETQGALSIDGTLQGPLMGSELPDFNMSVAVTDGYIKNPDLPKPIQNIQLKANASNKMLSIDIFTAQAGENNMSANGQIAEPMAEAGQLSMDMQANMNLSTINEFYDITQFGINKMGGQLQVDATLRGQTNQIERAVQSGQISLRNGFISHQSISKPLENITLESTLNGPTLSITKASFTSGNNQLSTSGSISNYLSNNRTLDVTLTGNAALDQITDYYDLAPSITELTGQADLDLQASGPIANPAEMQFDGQLTVQDVDMEGDALVQPVTNLSGELTLSPTTATLQSLAFNIGSSDIALNGSLQDYMTYLKSENDRTATPNLKGSYESTRLNMDELIDWSDTTTAPTPIHLPDLSSSVTAQIDTLIVTGVTMTNLDAQAGTNPSQIKLNNASIELLGGSATGSFVWDVPQPNRTNITFNGSLNGLQAGKFFSEYQVLGEKSNFHEYITGAFSANVDYSSELDEYLEPDITTTNMSGNFGMTKARMKGHPLQTNLASLLKANELNNLALDEWKSTFSLENSIFTIKNLRLTSGDIGMELNGTQHMVKNTIDFQTKLFLPSRFKKGIASVITKKAADALTQDNGTIMVPLRITGTQENPKIVPDKEVIGPVVKDFLKNKAGDLLKGLFDGNR
jgi:hypothetical protein